VAAPVIDRWLAVTWAPNRPPAWFYLQIAPPAGSGPEFVDVRGVGGTGSSLLHACLLHAWSMRVTGTAGASV
jgi:hypothetical protein